MNCQACNGKLSNKNSYCKNCRKVVNPDKLIKTPINNKMPWYSLKMFIYIFLNPVGRINRTKYLAYQLFGVITLSFVLFSVPKLKELALLLLLFGGPVGYYLILLTFALLLSMVYIKRIKDINKSPFWLLLLPIPIVGSVVAILLLFSKGTNGDNRYGLDPLK